MTTIEQAKKLDEILTLYLKSPDKSVAYSAITNIYPSIGANPISYYLKEEGMLDYYSTQNPMQHTSYQISSKGMLHLDAGGFTEQVVYRNRMDSYVIQSTELSKNALELTKDNLRLESDTLRISKLAFITSIISAIISLAALILPFLRK